MNVEGREIHSWSQHRSKIDVKTIGETGLAQEPHFDRLLIDFGGIPASQNGAKTIKHRCQNQLKIQVDVGSKVEASCVDSGSQVEAKLAPKAGAKRHMAESKKLGIIPAEHPNSGERVLFEHMFA